MGNTPLVRIRRVGAELRGVRIFAKLEYFNPGGSVKDRAARQMLLDGLASGALAPGATVIDSTSGNTGVAYAWLGAALGLKVALVMPPNVSAARKQIIQAYGAELIYSDPLEGSDGAIRTVRARVAESPGRYFYPDQYSNASNPKAHAQTTAPEIWAQTGGQVTHFVCGIGTGGTVMGTAQGLKALRPEIRAIAVEPAEAMHGLEGLKHMPSSIVPAIYREEALDEKISVPTDEGWDMAERLLKDEGLLVGHSAGAAMVGAVRVAERLALRGEEGVVVTVFPDRADRYFEARRWERTFRW
ncbi:MAG TPA: cysteine synthase family protein [Myxococcaceae bacterium]|nr:cysteine synthase family protein [Myxococcaceae bacterium]